VKIKEFCQLQVLTTPTSCTKKTRASSFGGWCDTVTISTQLFLAVYKHYLQYDIIESLLLAVYTRLGGGREHTEDLNAETARAMCSHICKSATWPYKFYVLLAVHQYMHVMRPTWYTI
jgi:predicted metalloprotease with PDZ domain